MSFDSLFARLRPCRDVNSRIVLPAMLRRVHGTELSLITSLPGPSVRLIIIPDSVSFSNHRAGTFRNKRPNWSYCKLNYSSWYMCTGVWFLLSLGNICSKQKTSYGLCKHCLTSLPSELDHLRSSKMMLESLMPEQPSAMSYLLQYSRAMLTRSFFSGFCRAKW